ncbi:unnamed protein product [Cyprideis torosa]|uniref:type I protein arginine methyltransferase n=1 Tax=Cyprideis torosa TaxID=163714 RepID=A0A7R8ZJY0_9CRUS|nr:unnamed protein product [Cyprideis torosa]CAG0880576.1 unnamed protein product [Cyprideis torosa]
MASSRENEIHDCSSDEGDDWEETEDEPLTRQNCICFFCANQYPSAESVLVHCREEHKVKFLVTGHIGFIKLVNFLRKCKPNAEDFRTMTSTVWENDDEFMRPHDAEDPMLTFDPESFPDLVELTEVDGGCAGDQCNSEVGNSSRSRLLSLLEDLRNEDVTVVDQENNSVPNGAIGGKSVRSFFESYDNPGIHREMIQDRIRTEAFRTALLNSSEILRGKIVLDLGCGTGILSLFAAEAGARLVVGVDMSDVIYTAMDVVRENGMLESVIEARDRFLKPGGKIFPDRFRMFLSAVSDENAHQSVISGWKNVYGFKMSALARQLVAEAHVEVVPAENIISESPFCIKEIDVNSIQGREEIPFTISFELTMKKTCLLTAFVGHFDSFFPCQPQVCLSTSPLTTPTHWKQTVFYCPEPISVQAGQVLAGEISCNPEKSNRRLLTVSIFLQGQRRPWSYSLA